MKPSSKHISFALLLAGLALAPAPLTAQEELPQLLGRRRVVRVLDDDTLVDASVRHRVGFEQLSRLNPGVPVWIPEPGTRLELPTRFVPPQSRRQGLVVNLPEMRLYDYATPEPEVFAVAIGDALDPSPVGSFVVGARYVDPVWNVPPRIRARKPELPARVPPGPSNPLGSRWLTLGQGTYGIHGTNTPYSIGRLATHGCIRLFEDDVRLLYARTPSRTAVEVVYQTVKLGRLRDGIYVEAHPDWYGLERVGERLDRTYARLDAMGLRDAVDHGLLERVLEESRGGPIRVGTLPGPLELEVATSRPGA